MTTSLEKKLFERKERGNYRDLKVVDSLIDFASNDYLGLARSGELAQRTFQEWEKHGGLLHGLGSTGSRLLTGNTVYAEQLEKEIAAFHGYEAGVLFSCGYMANMGLISVLANEDDLIFFDACVHASTLEGIRMSRAQAFPFRHHDLYHLEKRLKNTKAKVSRYICVESIYSTDGSQSVLQDICGLAKGYGAHVIVDEAHAVGIVGPQGRGLVAACGVTQDVFAQVTTFGKALGVHGAIVMGSRALQEGLINFARPYIYTTALPFYALAAIRSSYSMLPKLESERQRLRQLIERFRQAGLTSSVTPIQSIKIKGNRCVKEMARRLEEEGFDVRPLMSPTVRQGEEMLRICLHAFNTEDEVEALLNTI